MPGLANRMFEARLRLTATARRSVSLAEMGELVGAKLGREGFTATAVSRWMSGLQEPELAAIDAIADVCGVDPGWLAFGARSQAPAPLGYEEPAPGQLPRTKGSGTMTTTAPAPPIGAGLSADELRLQQKREREDAKQALRKKRPKRGA